MIAAPPAAEIGTRSSRQNGSSIQHVRRRAAVSRLRSWYVYTEGHADLGEITDEQVPAPQKLRLRAKGNSERRRQREGKGKTRAIGD